MSETRFPASTPTPGQSPRAAASSEPNARLIGVPNEVRAELQTQRASLRLVGEVVQQNDDGSVRVRTPRGDVDVQVREGQPRPERGSRVEIEVQPSRAEGRAQETATLRELRPQGESPQARTSATPVDVQVRGQGEAPPPRQPLPADVRHGQNAAERAAQALPPEGSVVRLQPFPARSAQSLPAPELTQQLVQSVLQPTVFQTQIIAAQAQSDLAQAALSIQRPAVAALPVTVPDTVVIPSASSTAAPVQTLSQTLPVLPTAQALSVATSAPITATIEGTATPAILTPAPAQKTAAPPPPPVTVSLKPAALDVVIAKITPPDVQFLSGSRVIETPSTVGTQVGTQSAKPETLILQNQNAGSLTGVVTNITPGALPVLSVFFPQLGSEQLFTLQFPSESVTIGTQIQVSPQVTSGAQSLASSPLATSMPLPVFLAPQPWPALDEALQILARAAPQTAQAMVNVTPSPAAPAQLGSAALFFVAALRGGDLGSWLGERAMNILKSEKGGQALSRLMGDGAAMSRVAGETMAQDWRTLNIPLYWDGDMHKIGLHYKHEHEEQDDGDLTLKGTRFVFDLALDVMGKVQLDGLFRPVSNAGQRLDLVVRTQEHFSEATRAEMRRVYTRALRESGVTGDLDFQSQPESWVSITVDQDSGLGVSA